MRQTAALAIVLLLAGCAAAPEPTPTPTVNAEACVAFETATITWLTSLTDDGGTVFDWDDELDAIDAIGLRAEGVVQDRILELVEEVPNVGDVYVYEEAREEVNDLIEAVARACDAEDAPIEPNTFVVD